jgi:hypothetical protein
MRHVLLWKIEVNRSSSFKKIFSWNACGIVCFAMRDEWLKNYFSITRFRRSEFPTRMTPLLDEVGLMRIKETF